MSSFYCPAVVVFCLDALREFREANKDMFFGVIWLFVFSFFLFLKPRLCFHEDLAPEYEKYHGESIHFGAGNCLKFSIT